MGDSAATLIKDGQIVASAEEERFSRTKHHIGIPWLATQYCLDQAGIGIGDVDHISHYWQPWILGHKIRQALKSLLISREMFQARIDRGLDQISDSYLGMFRIPGMITRKFGPGNFKFRYLEHHLCHAASAYLVSPFDSAAILTLDGSGEETTTLFAHGTGGNIRPLKRMKLPNSLGQFYSAVTNFLGFDMFTGDEWKVMGLAAYGKPQFYDFFAEKVLIRKKDHNFTLNIRVMDHHLAKRYQFSQEAIATLGPPRKPGEPLDERHQNIAASAQRVLEDVVLYLLGGLHEMTGEENLCLAGGTAFNSVMNGRIVDESPFRRFFIQPAAGDAGCSLGAAYLTYNSILKQPRNFQMEHAYWGPSFSNEECAEALQQANLRFETLPDDQLLPRVAKMIADGNVIGWFQGRMEFGPRALGGRSFLADPRRNDMREILNKQIKLREWFRPLAPSMLEERAEDIFGVPRHDPFMVTVSVVAEAMRSVIPSVVHVDGTARPQTVSRKTNPRYWGLINEFDKLTGVPALMNTSFNIQEPIVCRPQDAINTFRKSGFYALVLENQLVIRQQ